METDMDAPNTQWGKRIGIFFGVILVLLVVAYFVGTNSAFVKGVILPKVGSSMNAKISVGDVSVSPFSQLYVRQLKVETTGSEPLVTADEARVRYSLMQILKGNIQVDELTLVNPVVNLVEEPNGTSNLDPITKGDKGGGKPKSTEPTRLSVQNVSLKNGIVRQIKKNKDGTTDRTELQGLSVDLDRLGNGQKGNLKVATSLTMESRRGKTNNVLGGQFSGAYEISLNQELMPDTVKGSGKLTISRAEGSYKDMAGFNGSLDADLTPKEIRQVALRFARNDQALGQVRISGPMDVDRKEGNLRIEINSIDRNVLALASGGTGYDFGNTKVNSTNQITISQGGSFIAASGNVAGSSITLAQGAQKTPEMNLNLDYQVTVNTSEKSAVLQRINLTGESSGKQFLRTELDRQMNLSWGQAVKGYRDAAMNLVVTNFNLADWRAIIGTNVVAGVANVKVSLTSQQDGKLLNTEISARIDNLIAQSGSNRLENAALTLQGTGAVEQLKIVNLPSFTLALRQNDAPVLQASGTARYLMETKDTTAQLTIEGALPRLLALAAIPQAKAAAGNVMASAKYSDAAGKRSAVGNVGLSDFTGTYDKYSFTNFTTTFEYNVDLDSHDVTINRAALSFGQGFNKGGTVDIKGKYTLETKSGQFNFNTVDLNQVTLGPVLAPSLGENQLVSISMTGSGDAKLDPQGESSIKAEIKLANWVVQDKARTLPKTPLAVEIKVDGGMRKEVVDLRQFLVQLTPTERAKNALQLQARLDLSTTNPAPSTLSLTSESFDVTPYYEMFAGKPPTNAAAGTSAPAPQSTAGTGPEKEPEAMNLPFRELAADLKIDQLFLRDVAISNWTGKVAIRSNVVQISPFQLQLNGAPVSLNGNVDVGRPGYVYDLTLKAAGVPLAPLANSFSSGNSNSLQGTFLADTRIRGAGTTGPSLRRNLAGKADVNLTNMNYQVVGPKLRRVLVPISLALRVPELTETPINWVSLQTEIGNGVVNLKHLGVESQAFYAESAGTITLADVTTNSTLNLPLDLSLPRALAQRTGLMASDTPTNAKYAKLPSFVTVKGTVGAPESDINKLAIAGILARSAAGLGLGNANTEKLLGNVGSLLTGQSSSTNKTGTNAPSIGGLVQGISDAFGKKSTNSVTASTNAAPTNAVENVIDSLFRSKKKK